MIEPRSVEEWAELCQGKKRHFAIGADHYGAGDLMCIDCARGFAAQECAAENTQTRGVAFLDFQGTLRRVEREREALQQRVEALKEVIRHALEARCGLAPESLDPEACSDPIHKEWRAALRGGRTGS